MFVPKAGRRCDGCCIQQLYEPFGLCNDCGGGGSDERCNASSDDTGRCLTNICDCALLRSEDSDLIVYFQLPPSSNPRYFFDLAMEGKRLGRVVIEVQPTVAPKMAQNFGMLVTGEKGFGYKGCQFFQVRTRTFSYCASEE